MGIALDFTPLELAVTANSADILNLYCTKYTGILQSYVSGTVLRVWSWFLSEREVTHLCLQLNQWMVVQRTPQRKQWPLDCVMLWGFMASPGSLWNNCEGAGDCHHWTWLIILERLLVRKNLIDLAVCLSGFGEQVTLGFLLFGYCRLICLKWSVKGPLSTEFASFLAGECCQTSTLSLCPQVTIQSRNYQLFLLHPWMIFIKLLNFRQASFPLSNLGSQSVFKFLCKHCDT